MTYVGRKAFDEIISICFYLIRQVKPETEGKFCIYFATLEEMDLPLSTLPLVNNDCN
jgi:hypothetical protein